jgi:hypothetical protein
MFIPRAIVTMTLFLATTVNASYWVSDFNGSTQQYRVIRHGEVIMIEQLMFLHDGDTIIVDNPDGRILIVDEQNRRHILTLENTPFVIPESQPPTRLLINVRNWVASWWNTRGNQSTSTLAAVSRSALEPSILVAAHDNNFILSGSREIYVVWRGGIPPFEVSLRSESGTRLEQLGKVTDFNTTFPIADLRGGHYEITVTAGASESSFKFAAVGQEMLPGPARSVLDLDLPEEIRFGLLAMVLSGYDSWRMEALQLTHSYGMRQLELDLLSGNFPISDISEMSEMPDLSGLKE